VSQTAPTQGDCLGITETHKGRLLRWPSLCAIAP